MVGLGAQDDFAYAQDFVEKTGIASFRMVWDSSFASWRHYGITINSETWLIDTNGNRMGKKMFGLDNKDAILSAIS